MNKLTVMESACVFYSKSLKVSEIILSGWPKCTDCTDFLFCNPKIVRIVRIFCFVTLKLYGLYGFFFQIVRILSWKYTGFLIFTHFSKFFMKISKKKSRQNEVS